MDIINNTKPLRVKTTLDIGKSPNEVFEAIADPAKMSEYFITSGSGRMEEGSAIHWSWADYNAEADIKVNKVEAGRFISFTWPVGETETTVEISLESAGSAVTRVRVEEYGWDKTDEGIARLAEQTQGWMHMLLCLKAYLEYGINLRQVRKG